MRQLQDGSLIALEKGKPPEPPEGYERDEKNPYLFHLKLEDCSYREITIKRQKCCGGDKTIYNCNYLGTPVPRKLCEQCGASEEWIKSYQKRYG